MLWSKNVGMVLLLALAPCLLQAKASEKRAEIDQTVLTDGFLAAHPDLLWRKRGIEMYRRGDHEIALAYFKRAARYADKPSQVMVAKMYWDGRGVPPDRVLGYIWMDLAAERLYRDFVVYRERYWDQMSEVERDSIIDRGQALYAEYGDEAAKPRLEKILLRERRRATGSRTGAVGRLTVVTRSSGGGHVVIDPSSGAVFGAGGLSMSGEQYYAEEYWDPGKYWQLQGEIWDAPPREGRVDVGDLEPTDRRRGKDDE